MRVQFWRAILVAPKRRYVRLQGQQRMFATGRDAHGIADSGHYSDRNVAMPAEYIDPM
jgi:methionyl-tRNA synthetase